MFILSSDMVDFPDSSIEQSSGRRRSQTNVINDVDITLQDKGKLEIPRVVVSDDRLDKPRRLVIFNDNDLRIDQQSTTKTDNNDIENEVNVVKKIAGKALPGPKFHTNPKFYFPTN